MDRVLIAGVETVVGANLAASLAEECQVLGLSFSGPLPLAACETVACSPTDADTIRNRAAALKPEWFVFCGAAAVSQWGLNSTKGLEKSLPEVTRVLAAASRDLNSRFAMISSDAVFTGPWMFHAEGCPGLCPSPEAAAIREAETVALRQCPDALVVRTNCYGWSPAAAGPGWIETILADLEAGKAGPFDCVRHSTPILATELAAIVKQACDANLAGTYHVAGAERISPARFIDQLADAFDLPAPRSKAAATLSERPVGFGCGETSLQTRKIRSALGIAMPLVQSGVLRLRAQKINGYCDMLASPGRSIRDKVA
ncbi:MAG: sugar nucleotide-binding protein [Planctomycetaceae bacterium]